MRRKFEDSLLFVKQTISVISSSLLFSLVTGAIVNYRLADEDKCISNWEESIVLSTVYWTVSLLGPVLLLALPALTNLFVIRRRLNQSLKPFLMLSSMIVMTHFVLNIPGLITQFHRWASAASAASSASEYQLVRGKAVVKEEVEEVAKENKAGLKFVTYVLNKMLPELQFIYLPLGVLLMIPITFKCWFVASRSTTIEDSVDGNLGNGDLKEEGGKLYQNVPTKEPSWSQKWSNIDEQDETCSLGWTDIVQADIHQRLSRSQTTVV